MRYTKYFAFVFITLFVAIVLFASVDISSVQGSVAPPPPPTPVPVPICVNEDGRIDSLCDSPWQTATAYCTADGLDVYRIVDSKGILEFSVTLEEIEAFGIPPKGATEEQMLIAQSEDGEIRLYRLPTGEFQLNAPMEDNPNAYSYIWDGC